MNGTDTIGRNIRRIMYVIQNKTFFSKTRPFNKGAVAMFSVAMAVSGVSTAQSQQETFIDFSHPNVTIDLSVLDDGGYQRSTGPTDPTFSNPSGRKLLIPGGQVPSSMLHVPTVSGSNIAAPRKKKKIQAVARAPAPVAKPVAAPAPVVAKAPAPAPVKVEAPKPTQVTEAPKKLAVPAKPAAPAAVAKMEATAAPTVPVVKAVPRVVQKQAPKAPTPPPTPKAKTTPAPEQAAVPPSAGKVEPGNKLRVAFGADQTKLPDDAKKQLAALANKIKEEEDVRLQLMAYAGGPSLSSSLARRMSLSRALSIRSFLIENGVRSTRIDVRALGNKTTEEPLNRVDLNVTER